MATDTTTTNADSPPITAPPNRRRLVRRPDRNRPLEILSILLTYIIVVHFALKFVSFFLPPESNTPPSREEMLGLREAGGVLGFSLEAPLSKKRTILQHRKKHDALCSRVSPSRNGRSYSIMTAHSSLSESLQEDYLTANEKEKVTNIAEMKNNTIITTNKKSPRHKSAKQKRPQRKKKQQRPRIPILSYQNNHVIVSKPTSMTMHHTSNTRWGRSKSPVLQTTITKQLSRKPYLVHRLDHRTSGAVIMGFDSKSASELHGRLRKKDAIKLYVALVRGDLRGRFQYAAAAGGSCDDDVDDCTNGNNGVDMSVNGDGSIIGSHGRVPPIMTPGGGGEQQPRDHGNSKNSEHSGKITVNLPIKVKVDEITIEKEAETDFYFLSSIDLEDDDEDEDGNINSSNNTTATIPYVTKSVTLLLCHPRTGRTHQIRRHVRKAFEAPIIGDSEHGDSRVNRFWRTTVGLDRLGLHCWYLGLPPSSSSNSSVCDGEDGGDDGSIECMAPLTPDFMEALQHEALGPLWEEATRVEPRLEMEPYDERGGSFGRDYQKRCGDDEE